MNKKKNYKTTLKKYQKKPIVNLTNYFTANDFIILEKLDIKIENKLYTEKEVEKINNDIIMYYEYMQNKTSLHALVLEKKNISKCELEKILNIFSKISTIYNF